MSSVHRPEVTSNARGGQGPITQCLLATHQDGPSTERMHL